MRNSINSKFLLLLLFILTLNVNGQQLTIEETFDYIEYIENVYQGYTTGGHKVTVEYAINNEGILTKETLLTNENEVKVTKKVSVHVNDLSKEIEYNGDSRVIFKCQNKNCFSIDESHRYYNSYSNNGLYVFVRQEYQAKKVITALKYLFSLIDQKNYIRDANDPFSNVTIVTKKSNSSNKINLTESNGTFKIQVRFDNFTTSFVLDSGASEVTISSTVERKLIENGTISSNSYLPDGLYKIADGTIIKQRRVLLKQLSVGGYTVKNISASIGNENSPLLLGKNFLDYFKSWSINNNQQTLELTN